jgi:insertion element IS1 protein InsB
MQIKNFKIEKFCTDYSQSYDSVLPSQKHIKSKKEMYSIEGMNSLIGHYLARFKRRTKRYSKSLLAFFIKKSEFINLFF